LVRVLTPNPGRDKGTAIAVRLPALQSRTVRDVRSGWRKPKSETRLRQKCRCCMKT